MRWRFTMLLQFAALTIAGSAFAAQTTYVNPRFGTSISFPDDVFTIRDLPSDNGDGQTWRAEDGSTLLVFGRHNLLDETPASLVAAAKRDTGRRVTYAKAGRDWAVLSGIETGSVFYERYSFSRSGVIHTVVIGYPVALKARYDRMAGEIAGSLRGP